MATVPFDKPYIFNAVHKNGFVDIPSSLQDPVDQTATKVCQDGTSTTTMSNTTTTTTNNNMTSSSGGSAADDRSTSSPVPGPISLQRRQTMSGNIVVIEPTTVDRHHHHDGDGGDSFSSTTFSSSSSSSLPSSLPAAFWLQRKLGRSTHGSVVRLGYLLRSKKSNHHPNGGSGSSSSNDDEDNSWELETSTNKGKPTMVMVHIWPSQILEAQEELGSINPLYELAALQRIARHHDGNSSTTKTAMSSSSSSSHVIGTHLVAMGPTNLYSILPYHADGTLLEFCQSTSSVAGGSDAAAAGGGGGLDEPLARFLFRQIVQGLKTLQETGLCHRNLSLDAVVMDGDHLDIGELGWVLRFNPNAPTDEDRTLPPPGGSDPQYIAPEYFQSTKGRWDGFRADLWAAGLMLYSMVVGSEGLFTAPIAEDKSFARLCIKGDVRGQLKRYGKLVGRDYSGMSDDLVDLLRNMMRADPNQRPSLEEVMEHPWLTKDEIVSPSAWMAANRPDTPALLLEGHKQRLLV